VSISNLKIFKICEEDHLTERCPLLLGLVKVLRKSSKESNRLPGITQNPLLFDTWNNAYFPEQVSQHVYNPAISWQTFNPPPIEYPIAWS